MHRYENFVTKLWECVGKGHLYERVISAGTLDWRGTLRVPPQPGCPRVCPPWAHISYATGSPPPIKTKFSVTFVATQQSLQLFFAPPLVIHEKNLWPPAFYKPTYLEENDMTLKGNCNWRTWFNNLRGHHFCSELGGYEKKLGWQNVFMKNRDVTKIINKWVGGFKFCSMKQPQK